MSIRAHALRHLHDGANSTYIYGQDPEKMHHLIVKEFAPKLETNPFIINQLYNALNVDDKILQTEFLGHTYKNPVGLAAGLLKQPLGLKFWEALGVGHIEVGSVLGEPREGNAKPRIRRYPNPTGELDVVNQMGLPQQGAALTAAQFQQREDNGMMPSIPVWANLTNTPRPGISLGGQIEDIKKSMLLMHPYVKLYVINVSCPNTGENLQKDIEALLAPLVQARDEIAQMHGEKPKPLLAKIGPVTSNDNEWLGLYPQLKDNTPDEIKAMLDVFVKLGFDGVVATNTAKEQIGRPLEEMGNREENHTRKPRGGMSGNALHERSLETVSLIKEYAKNQLKIVGLGGIGAGKGPKERKKSAQDMLDAGADMIQMYTGIVNNMTSPHFINKGIVDYRYNKLLGDDDIITYHDNTRKDPDDIR